MNRFNKTLKFIKEKKYFTAVKEEKGIATVLTIGVLALLAALAIGFLSESIILQKISKNNLNLERSRLLAQSMVQRTIAAVTNYNQISSDSLITFYSQYIDDDPTDTDELNSAMSTTFNNIEYYDWDYDNSDTPSWQYIRTERNAAGKKKIIGRVAYVIVNNIGKLDPSAIVDSGSNIATAITEDTDLFTGADPGGAKVLGRPGRDVREIYARKISSTDILDSEKLQLMSADNSDTQAAPEPIVGTKGQLPEGTRWFDISQFIGAVGVGTTTSDIQTRTDFNNWFFTDNPADPEVFWIDIDDDDIIDSQYEQFHRFNLTRTDWNSLSVSDLNGADTVLYTSTYTDAGVKSIPWLKNWKNAGGMGSAENAKNQIIANLIDYNDSNSEASTDYPGTDPPTYVGLEKVPYINEIGITFQSRMQSELKHLLELPFLPYYTYQAKIKMNDFHIELINMYDTGTINTRATIEELSGSYKFDCLREGFDPNTETVIFTINDIDEDKYTDISIDANEYIGTGNIPFLDISSDWYPNYLWFDNIATDYSIYDFKLTNLKIRLNDADGTFYDYSNILENRDTSLHILSPDGVVLTTYFSIQVNDPRQNLCETDWVDSDFTTYPTIAGTLGDKNTSADPSTGDDLETATDPKINISTAYIRNAPMQSPWELGFIHRGAAWQTINLKAYNMTEDTNPDAGGNGYSDGDANILDQIKMTANTETYGKVNINSQSDQSDQPTPSTAELLISDNRHSDYTATITVTNNTLSAYDPWEIEFDFTDTIVDLWGIAQIKSSSGNHYVIEGNTDNPANRIINPGASKTFTIRGEPRYVAATLDNLTINGSPTEAEETSAKNIYTALFTDIYFGLTDYSDPGVQSDTQITNAHSSVLADDIITESNSDSGIFKTRGQILRDTHGISNLYTVNEMNNDASQEELIGKFINLTTAGTSNNLTLIAVAQTIKDVGGGVTVTKNGTSIPTEFDRYNKGADTILAEQKILVILIRDPITFKWEVKKLKYLHL